MKQPPTSPAINPEPGFLPLDQAARWVGVSTRTLKRWIKKGLPKYQAGPSCKVLLRTDDIEGFLTKIQSTPALECLVEEVFRGMQGKR